MGSAAHMQLDGGEPSCAGIADCTSRHILESAGIQGRGVSRCRASSAAGRVARAVFFFLIGGGSTVTAM